ncbi:helix-turn-helix domain-containing protein [Natronoglomus mannanivorans]|uniref:helix-turn-helix domain-containing protein n=1 Tax=Natronoglomus mannanivorans TaxID=2979990 RepID=UPI003CCD1B58
MYRVEWRENTGSIIDLVIQLDAVVLEASGGAGYWELRIRFDNREQVSRFQQYCVEREISFSLQRLYGPSQPLTGGQYGLTSKQQEALVTAWEAGYFDTPREVTLDDIASTLDITRQSLSQRLRRAHHALVRNTIIVTPPAPNEEH